MDFNENYFKAYLHNCHNSWGIYSYEKEDIIHTIENKNFKEAWDLTYKEFGKGHEVVAIFPQ